MASLVGGTGKSSRRKTFGRAGTTSFENPIQDATSQSSSKSQHDRAEHVVEVIHAGAVSALNYMERKTGLDLDGDGNIGVVDNANEKGKRKGPRAVTSSVSGRVELRVEKKDQDTLQVTILQAKDLRAMDLGQKNDVFIEVVLVTSANVDGRETPLKKEQKKQTTTQTNAGSSATWGKDGEGETLEFGLAEHLEDDESDSTMTYKLVIQAWDEDPAEKVNDLIGEGRRGIDHLVKLPVGSAVQNWCEVVDRDYGITQFFTRLESQADKAKDMASKIPFFLECLFYSISPNSRPKLLWDTWILLLVLYSSFYTPYQAAFYSSEAKRETQDIVVDLCFWADMVLTFWTGYDRGFEVVRDKSAIVKHYLFGWFVVDCVATMDWESLWDWFVRDSDEDRPPQWVSLLRMIKVFRLARAGRIINRLTMTLSIHTKFIDAGNFLLYVFVVCHVLACLFFVVPVLTGCVKDQEMANAAFADPAADTIGWYWEFRGKKADGNEPSCVQGSWRQHYALEAVCEPCVDVGGPEQLTVLPDDRCDDLWYNAKGGAGSAKPIEDKLRLRICQETAEFGHTPGATGDWTPRENMPEGFYLNSSSPYNHSFIAAECAKCMRPRRLWYDALYWSLTTMTTIGYGDRGPSTEMEIIFVMGAEFVGLSFFAILLTQINTINEVLSEESDKLNNQKNSVVQFLKQHNLSPQVVNESVKYLNFRATSLTGSQFDDDDERFHILSPGIRQKIRVELCKPVLKKVRVFGWDATDIREEEHLRSVFDKIDTSGTEQLSHDEVKQLFTELNLSLSDSQFTRLFNEMDINSTGEIDYAEFRNWWYIKKDGKPHMARCPDGFLNMMAELVQTQAYDKGEHIVEHMHYGRTFGIILQGSCKIWRDLDRVDEDVSEEFSEHDRECVFGFAACLPSEQYLAVQRQTKNWSVVATSYVDMAWITRAKMLWCFHEAWPKGYLDMVKVSVAHYEMTEQLAQTAQLTDDHVEFPMVSLQGAGRNLGSKADVSADFVGDLEAVLSQEDMLDHKLDDLSKKVLNEKSLSNLEERMMEQIRSHVELKFTNLDGQVKSLAQEMHGMKQMLSELASQKPGNQSR